MPRDLFTERLTLRRLRVLIQQLPDDAALRRSDPKHQGWTPDTWKLTDLVDLTALSLWQRGGDPNAPRPTPLRRPGVAPPVDKASQIRARAEAWRDRQRRRGVA